MKSRPFRVNFEDIYEMRAEDLIESEALMTVLKNEVPKAIELAIKERKTYAIVFEINSFGVYIEIHKRDWINALSSCLTMFANQEEFERCSEISKLIVRLESTAKKKGNGKLERV